MSCPVCPQKLTREVYDLVDQACASCQRHIRQMMAGFHGVIAEPKKTNNTWDNSDVYEEWKASLVTHDADPVHLNKKGEYLEQRCDIRDMKRVVGLPKFLPLERQVFTAWIMEGQRDQRIQEVLGLTYSQVFQVKKIIQKRLQKQMSYYHEVKKLEKEGTNG